jgi:hypothetical protein
MKTSSTNLTEGDFVKAWECPNIVTWELNRKVIVFFLQEGEAVERGNVIDVEVYPKTKEEPPE